MDALKKEERFNTLQVQTALESARGNVSVAARTLGATRSTLYNYLNRYPELKTVLQDSRESMIDAGETALHAAVLKGEGWAVCFLLKTLGRSRGYIEKHEITVTDDRAAVKQVLTDWLQDNKDNPGATVEEGIKRLSERIPEIAKYGAELVQELGQIG